MEFWNATLPVIAVVVGYGGTLLTELLRDRRAKTLSTSEREAQTLESRRTERRKFELETLTETQTALARLVRAMGKAHHFDTMQAKEAGHENYPSSQFPQDISDESFNANRDLGRLENLIMDDDARSKVSKFRGAVAKIGVYRGNVTGANNLVASAVDAYDLAVAAVTSRIRGIYNGSIEFDQN